MTSHRPHPCDAFRSGALVRARLGDVWRVGVVLGMPEDVNEMYRAGWRNVLVDGTVFRIWIHDLEDVWEAV